MPKRNQLVADRRRRALTSLVTALLMVSMVAVVPVLRGGAARAATASPVPVAGVDAFGIGAGQLGVQALPDEDVAFDAKGDLFVADTANNRVIEYKPSSATSYPQVGTVVAGTGGQGSGLNQLNNPSGVALDANGDLFVGDSSNNRVMEYAYNAATGTYPSAGKIVAGTGTALGARPAQRSGRDSLRRQGRSLRRRQQQQPGGGIRLQQRCRQLCFHGHHGRGLRRFR